MKVFIGNDGCTRGQNVMARYFLHFRNIATALGCSGQRSRRGRHS